MCLAPNICFSILYKNINSISFTKYIYLPSINKIVPKKVAVTFGQTDRHYESIRVVTPLLLRSTGGGYRLP